MLMEAMAMTAAFPSNLAQGFCDSQAREIFRNMAIGGHAAMTG